MAKRTVKKVDDGPKVERQVPVRRGAGETPVCRDRKPRRTRLSARQARPKG